jgi:hypothetical protein
MTDAGSGQKVDSGEVGADRRGRRQNPVSPSRLKFDSCRGH